MSNSFLTYTELLTQKLFEIQNHNKNENPCAYDNKSDFLSVSIQLTITDVLPSLPLPPFVFPREEEKEGPPADRFPPIYKRAGELVGRNKSFPRQIQMLKVVGGNRGREKKTKATSVGSPCVSEEGSGLGTGDAQRAS